MGVGPIVFRASSPHLLFAVMDTLKQIESGEILTESDYLKTRNQHGGWTACWRFS